MQNKLQLILDPARSSYKHKEEMAFFKNKQNMTTRQSLQKMLKGTLYPEIKANKTDMTM